MLELLGLDRDDDQSAKLALLAGRYCFKDPSTNVPRGKLPDAPMRRRPASAERGQMMMHGSSRQ